MANKKFSQFTLVTDPADVDFLAGYDGTDNVRIAPSNLGTGEVNTGSNVGLGSEVFKQKTGVDLEFRTLFAGTNITLTQNANDITIASSGGGGGTESFVYQFSAYHSTNTATNYYRFRNKSNSTMVSFSETATTVSGLYYVTLSVPVDSFVKKIQLRNTQLNGTCTQTRIKMFKNYSTLEYQGSYINWQNTPGSGAGNNQATWETSLTSTDNTFSAGDAFDIGFQSDGTMGGIHCSILLEII
jgi:hypothetical protein